MIDAADRQPSPHGYALRLISTGEEFHVWQDVGCLVITRNGEPVGIRPATSRLATVRLTDETESMLTAYWGVWAKYGRRREDAA